MNVFFTLTLLALLTALPCAATTYSTAELKRMFNQSSATSDMAERTRLRIKIAQAAPDSAYGLASRAFLMRKSLTPQASVSIYTKALELDPDIPAAYFNRGAGYAELKQYDKAIKDYKKHISLKPEAGSGYQGLGDCYMGMNRDEKAIEYYGKALQLDHTLYFSYNNRGALYIRRGEYDKAITDFNAALKLAQFAMAYMNRGDAWAGKKEFQKALADYNTAEDMIGGEPDLYTRRGKMYLNIPDYFKAKLEFNKALAAEPGHVVALRGLGNACYYQKDYDCAEDAYKRTIAAAPDTAEAYSALAVTYQNKKRLDLAEEVLKKAVARLPGRKDLWDKLIAVQTWTGDAKGSEASLTEVISSGEGKAQDYFSRGQARLENKDYKGAEADLKKALRGNPGSVNATVYLALAFLGSGRRSEALDLFSSVAETEPTSLAKLRRGAAATNSALGPNLRASLREMLGLYDEESNEEKPATLTARAVSGGGAPAQDSCFCVHYTGGMPPYLIAKTPGARDGCKTIKFKPDPAKPGISGLRNCKEFQETE